MRKPKGVIGTPESDRRWTEEDDDDYTLYRTCRGIYILTYVLIYLHIWKAAEKGHVLSPLAVMAQHIPN